MEIWLINPYGPIPGEGWRDYRFTLAARALVKRGHTVKWWTAAFAHQTKTFRSRQWASRAAGERFTIELVPTPSYSRNIGLARLWFEFVFARRFAHHAKNLTRPDAIIAADPPQFCGAAGRRLARHFAVPLVIDCLDLWPELFVSAAPPVVRPFVRIAAAPLFGLRRRNIEAADLVVAVAETYRHAVTRGSATPSMTIPIGVDVQSLAVPSSDVSRDRVRVVYAGSLGEAYDLETVVEAAALMRDEPIEFVIAGRGPADERLRSAVGRSDLHNVTFAGKVSVEELPQFYATADLAVAPYASGSTVALPVKLFDYLAAGLPVITSVRAEALDVLQESGAGVAYKAGDARSLADVLRALLADRDRRTRMVQAARSAASRFDSAVLYERYADAVETAVAQTRVSLSASSFEIRVMTPGDVRETVAVHMAAFPNFFLSSLGPIFLAQFYGALAAWPEGVGVIAIARGRLVGFAVGSISPRSFYRRLFVRRALPIGVGLFSTFVRRPSVFVRVARRAMQRSGGETPAGAELMSLAVAPDAQHAGIGRALLDAFTARIAEARAQCLWLTTDAVENDSVKRFYEKAGFSLSRSFTTTEGRKLDEYRRDL